MAEKTESKAVTAKDATPTQTTVGKKRTYIGPQYPEGGAIIVHGVDRRLDPRSWDAAEQDRFLKIWPVLEKFFSNP